VPDKFTVALIQMSCGPEPADNLAKALDRVAEAARKGASVVCLPELFQTQYFCQREDAALFDLAESIPGPTTEKLAAAARQNKIVLIASLFEKRAAGPLPQHGRHFRRRRRLGGIYRKMHIPDDPLYYEKFYFTPGDLGFKAFDTKFGRKNRHAGLLGPVVSGRRAPDGAQGASILFYPTAIGWHPAEKAEFGVAQHDAWRTIQRGACHRERRLCWRGEPRGLRTRETFAANARRGKGLEFWGGSFFCDPFGRVLAEASTTS
jgi:N-carbamoylputrescine amidase